MSVLFNDYISRNGIDVSKYNRNQVYSELFNVRLLRDTLKGKILSMNDYDCDGLMTGLVAYIGFTILGYDINLYYNTPDVFKGNKYKYGLHPENVNYALSLYPDTKTIITGDTGIGTDFSYLNGKYNIIVTDHHVGDISPSVNATFNPQIDHEFKYMCGCATMYQLILQLATILNVDNETMSDIKCLEVFAGIATLADSMKIDCINISMVKRTIDRLCGIAKQFIYSRNPMINVAYDKLYELLMHYDSKLHIESDYLNYFLTSDFIAFYLVPLFNTIKRLNKPCSIFYDIFINGGEIDQFLSLNSERKRIVEDIMIKLKTSPNPLNKPPFIYFIDEQNTNVAGLIAGRLMEETGFPIIVLDSNSYHGSGRSPDYFPLVSNLKLNGFNVGGHEWAFGIGLNPFTMVDDLDRLYSYLCNTFVKKDIIDYDYYIPFTGSNDLINIIEFYQELNKLQPFGSGNKKPKIALSFSGNYDFSVLLNSHLKYQLPFGDKIFNVLVFNTLDRFDTCVAIGSIEPNLFKGEFSFNFIANKWLPLQ